MRFIKKNGRVIPIKDDVHPGNKSQVESWKKEHKMSSAQVKGVASNRGINLKKKMGADEKADMDFHLSKASGVV